MVSRKVAKKTAATKKTAKAVVPKKVVGKKVAAKKRASRQAPQSLDLNQVILAEARALLARRSAGGPSLSTAEFLRILQILEEISEEIRELIVLLSTRDFP